MDAEEEKRIKRTTISSYLLPIFLQRRHGGEIAGVVHELELLEDAVVGQDVHDDAPDDANASRHKSKEKNLLTAPREHSALLFSSVLK